MSTKTYNYIVILFFLTIIFGSSIPGKNIPSSYIFSKDKLLHIIEYFLLGFLLFTLITSNPFNKMLEMKENGLGFNPILQDPALAIHPPLLYIGYIGFSSVFSLAIATLKLK